MKSQLPFDSLSTENRNSSWKKQQKNSLIFLGVAFALLVGVTIAQNKSDQQKKSTIEQVAIPLAALAVAGGAWFASTLGKSFGAPINRLQRVSQELIKGNYQVRTDLGTTDTGTEKSDILGEGEVGVLAGQLNNLAQNLETRREKMQQRTELLSQLVELSCLESTENNPQIIEARISKLLNLARSMIGAQKIYCFQGKQTDIIAQSVGNEQTTDYLQTPQIIAMNNGGLIIVGSNTWSESEKKFLEKFAKQLGHILSQFRDRQHKERESELVIELRNLTLKIASSLEQEKLFSLVVQEARKDLESDRVIVYQFDKNWKGTVVAESVEHGYPKAIKSMIHDPCFAANYVEKYKKGRIQATNDIQKAGLTECHLKQLEPFQVKQI